MPTKQQLPQHPGKHIWTTIIQPSKMTLTAAAAAMNISHVSLSLLLNGKMRLSTEMAYRFEVAFGAFGANMEDLMRLQSEYDAILMRKNAKAKGLCIHRIPRLEAVAA